MDSITQGLLATIKELEQKEARVFALIGDESHILGHGENSLRVMFRGNETYFSPKTMRKKGPRYYVSQVTLEARAGRNPSHLFAGKPQTDRER